jgi:hypothetical protein
MKAMGYVYALAWRTGRDRKKQGIMTLKNPYPWGTQKHRLLDRLHQGAITNAEIVRDLGIFNYRDKISEVRADMAAQGLALIAEPARGSKTLWTYCLVKVAMDGQATLI